MAHTLYPALIAAMTGYALWAPTWDVAARLGLPATATPAVLTLGGIALFYSLIACLERVRPYRRDWWRSHDDLGTDTLHLLVTGPASAAFFDAAVRGAAASGGALLASRLGSPLWPAHAPMIVQLFLAVLVAEFGHYAFHRLSHEHPLLWRLHATHHSAQRLYWLNATRFHPLDLVALITCQSTPLLLLGIDPQAYVSYTLFASVYGQLQHCNVVAPTGRVLDWVFSTPGIHRWHHSTDLREGNHNYGAILSLWDHVFDSYFRPRDRDFEGVVGIAAMPAFPTHYLGQLLSPVRWQEIADEPRDAARRRTQDGACR